MNPVDVATSDGKYFVIQNDQGYVMVRRYGEAWRDVTGDKLILQLAMDLQDARDRIKELTDKQ